MCGGKAQCEKSVLKNTMYKFHRIISFENHVIITGFLMWLLFHLWIIWLPYIGVIIISFVNIVNITLFVNYVII